MSCWTFMSSGSLGGVDLTRGNLLFIKSLDSKRFIYFKLENVFPNMDTWLCCFPFELLKMVRVDVLVKVDVPSVVVSLLQEFEYVFPEDIPSGLPLLRRIELHIDLVPRVVIPGL